MRTKVLANIYRLKQKLSMASKLARWGMRLLIKRNSHAWILKQESGAGGLQILVQGERAFAEHCFSFFCARQGEFSQLRPQQLAEAESNADLKVSESLFWQLGRSEVFSSVVEASCVLGDSLDEHISRNLSTTLKRRLKKALKRDYAVRESSDTEQLREFFHQLYQPMVARRHGVNRLPAEEAYFTDNPSRVMDKSLITVDLATEQDDQDLRAAAVVYYNRITGKLILDAYGFSSALLDDGKSYEQAFTLINYEFLKKAWALGAKTASLGESDNAMSGGSFYYKRQWGMGFSIKGQYFLRHCALHLDASSEAGWQYLYDKPYCRKAGDGLEMVIAVPCSDIAPDALVAQVRRCLPQGLTGLCVRLPESLAHEPFEQALLPLELKLRFEAYSNTAWASAPETAPLG